MVAVCQMEQAKREAAPRVSGISNLAYDLTALLHNKLKGVAAFEEYKQDARDAGDQEALTLLEHLEQRAVEDAHRLKDILCQRLK